MEPNYRKHLFSLLKKYSGLSNAKIESYLDESSMKLWEEAITHSSFDPHHNYDLLELYGDTKLNEFASEYIRFVHPRVINIQWLDKIRHYLKSRDVFMKFTIVLDLARFLKIGADSDIRRILSDTSGKEQKRYEKLMGDISEAWFQALFIVSRSKSAGVGVAYQVCYNVAMKLFEATVGNIPLDPEIYFDAKTMFKELVEKYPFNWIEKGQINSIRKTRKNEDGSITVSFFDKEGNMVGTATEVNEHKAEQSAAKNALEVLREKGAIVSVPDPYERTIKPIR